MATMLGSLLVSLGLESAQFDRNLGNAKKSLASFGRSATQMGTQLSVAVTAPLAIFGKTAFDAAIQSREAFAQVEQALSTMGGASGKTAGELQKAAKQLETFSNFDDDDILQKVTANLLTFGNVAGDQFDRAQQAAVDLSARLGQDLQSSAIQLGKALNDPVKGITALSRVGVSFTEDQKAMIKAMTDAGDVAGAQNLILAELERQYGGAARAAREAAPGGDQLQAWRTLQEVIGERLVLAFEKLEQVTAPIINAFLGLDEETQTVIVAVAALAAAIGPALIVLGAMASGLGALVTLGPAVVAMFGAVKAAALLLMANPILLGFAAVLAGIYLVWQNWDKIEPIVRRVYEGVKRWLIDNLGPIFDRLKRKVEAVTGFFKDMYVAVVGNSYVPDMVNEIGVEFARLQGLMVDPARKATEDVTEATRQMAREVTALLDRIFPEFARARQMSEELALLDAADISPELRERARMRLLGERYGAKATVSEGLLKEAPLIDFGKQLQVMQEQAEKTAVVVSESFGQMADRTLQALQRMTNAFRGGGFLDILGSVVNLGLQLGGMGAFGKSVQARINSRVPGFANGTRFAPGGLAMVGERGPELVNLPRGSQVIPNRELAGMGGAARISVGIDPRNGNVTAFVNGQIAASTPAIMEGGANVAASKMGRAQSRRVPG